MINLAIKLARTNLVERPLPRFACVLTDNKTTYVGFNSRKTHPLQFKFNPKSTCLHAEMDAIRQAVRVHGTDLGRFSMFVARVHRGTGEPILAKPCSGCQGAIVAFNVKDVEWTK
jgi:tRNA(Arg) A34 adenosine deaminase TadA